MLGAGFSTEPEPKAVTRDTQADNQLQIGELEGCEFGA